MCGIAGMLTLSGAPSAREELATMASLLRHRGPDEFGVFRDRYCGLAHSRLSIVDLASGQQPLANEDDSLWIVFNGEIFNYVELRKELLALGHRFRTHSDTEVIVHAWEAWGEDCFKRMNGQWAIALWDRRQRKLVLSRDRFGIRPLYLARHEGRLYFASEVKAIFGAAPSFARAFDPRGIDETLTFWSVVPPQTVFQGVEELEPGTVLVVTGAGETRRRFWHPNFSYREHVRDISIDDAAAEVEDALRKATILRVTQADVPVGSYLSGGLDSSLIARLGLEATTGRLQTFSLRFEDREYDETAYQRLMVEALGSDHREVVCTRQDVANCFPEVVYYAERPMLRTGPAPMFLLSRLVRQAGVKVVLTGEGADEVFGGYDIFREAKVRRFCARRPTETKRARLLEKLYPYLARSPVGGVGSMSAQFFLRGLDRALEPGFGHALRWQGASALKRLFSGDLRANLDGFDPTARLLASLPEEFSHWNHLRQDQYLEMRTLLAGYLLSSQGDRMLMGNSVEGRFPFLDCNVAALAATLPAGHLLHVLNEKYVLKHFGKKLIPPSIIHRTKQPYRVPDALSFVGAGRPAYVDEVLRPEAIRAVGVFDPARVDQLWKKCLAAGDQQQFSNADNMALVAALSTQLLHQSMIAVCPKGVPVTLRTLAEYDTEL